MIDISEYTQAYIYMSLPHSFCYGEKAFKMILISVKTFSHCSFTKSFHWVHKGAQFWKCVLWSELAQLYKSWKPTQHEIVHLICDSFVHFTQKGRKYSLSNPSGNPNKHQPALTRNINVTSILNHRREEESNKGREYICDILKF